MKKIFSVIIVFMMSTSSFATCPSTPTNPVSPIVMMKYDYESTTAGYNSFLGDIALILNSYPVSHSTTPSVPSSLSSAFASFLLFSQDYILPEETDCEDNVQAYLVLHKRENSNCAEAEVDLVFSIKGYKKNTNYTGVGCQGQQGNWQMSFKLPSTDIIPDYILSRF